MYAAYVFETCSCCLLLYSHSRSVPACYLGSTVVMVTRGWSVFVCTSEGSRPITHVRKAERRIRLREGEGERERQQHLLIWLSSVFTWSVVRGSYAWSFSKAYWKSFQYNTLEKVFNNADPYWVLDLLGKMGFENIFSLYFKCLILIFNIYIGLYIYKFILYQHFWYYWNLIILVTKNYYSKIVKKNSQAYWKREVNSQ